MNALQIANMLKMNTVETIYLQKASEAAGVSPAEFVRAIMEKNLAKKGSCNPTKKRGKSAAVKA